MNFLAMLPNQDRQEIKREIVSACAEALSLFFFPSGDFKDEQMRIWTCTEDAVTRVLARHGFRQPKSDTAAVHNLSAQQNETERHNARMLVLSTLISESKKVVDVLDHPAAYLHMQQMEIKNALLRAILAVEREFK